MPGAITAVMLRHRGIPTQSITFLPPLFYQQYCLLIISTAITLTIIVPLP